MLVIQISYFLQHEFDWTLKEIFFAVLLSKSDPLHKKKETMVWKKY